jgi:hypothetical protein
MNMTTTLTAHAHRAWPVAVVAALAAIAVAIVIARDGLRVQRQQRNGSPSPHDSRHQPHTRRRSALPHPPALLTEGRPTSS